MDPVIGQIERFRSFSQDISGTDPLICLQGGGLKGAWQAAVVEVLLRSNLHPSAAYGTSAGALNSVLISVALGGDSQAPTSFWRTLSKLGLRYGKSRLGGVLWRLPAAFREMRKNPTPRARSLLPYGEFRDLIADALPDTFQARLNTYIEITRLDTSLPPTVLPYRGPSLWLHPGGDEFEATFVDPPVDPPIKVPIADALACSCAVPGLIDPGVLAGIPVSDGGVLANLPIDRLPEHGALSGNSIILVLCRPLSALDPASSDIDYRTIRSLRRVQAIQRCELRRYDRNPNGCFNSLTFPPVFLIAPKQTPRLENPLLAAIPKIWDADISSGKATGERFVCALDRFFRKTDRALDEFLLLRANLPRLPRKRPSRPIWYSFANAQW